MGFVINQQLAQTITNESLYEENDGFAEIPDGYTGIATIIKAIAEYQDYEHLGQQGFSVRVTFRFADDDPHFAGRCVSKRYHLECAPRGAKDDKVEKDNQSLVVLDAITGKSYAETGAELTTESMQEFWIDSGAELVLRFGAMTPKDDPTKRIEFVRQLFPVDYKFNNEAVLKKAGIGQPKKEVAAPAPVAPKRPAAPKRSAAPAAPVAPRRPAPQPQAAADEYFDDDIPF